MANLELLAMLKQDVATWNKWRKNSLAIWPVLDEANLVEADIDSADLQAVDLSRADLSRASLRRVNLNRANLTGAILNGANLSRADANGTNFRKADLRLSNLQGADLSAADLRGALLNGASMIGANLSGADLDNARLERVNLLNANLRGANLHKAHLSRADLSRTNLEGANLCEANLKWANMSQANLIGANLQYASLISADLSGTNLSRTDMTMANLKKANLMSANLVETILDKANLSNCLVYGISAWELRLNGTRQSNLIITRPKESTITVDNLEIAQFIYLLLNNEKIRSVIDTIARKVVLILGRFTPERKAVLDAIREELRKRDYLPVLFDFDKPTTRDITETMRTLAHLSRFIIADLSDPKSIPLELQAVIPDLAVPVQPLLLSSQQEFSMFVDLRKKYHWVLATHQYTDINDLLASLGDKVIAPAEQKAKELEKR